MPIPLLIGIGAAIASAAGAVGTAAATAGAAVAAAGATAAAAAGTAGTVAAAAAGTVAGKAAIGAAGAAVVAKVAHSKGYNSGHSDGSISGYNRASEVYEEKFEKQAEEFLSYKKAWWSDREEYEALLDVCECEIQRLQDELNEIYSTEGEDLLRKMKNKYRSLKQLAS